MDSVFAFVKMFPKSGCPDRMGQTLSLSLYPNGKLSVLHQSLMYSEVAWLAIKLLLSILPVMHQTADVVDIELNQVECLRGGLYQYANNCVGIL